MSEKQIYYVSVSSKKIEYQPDSNEQLTVTATVDEIDELQQLLDQVQLDDEKIQLRAPIPFKSADHDETTDKYNEDIIKVYDAIYELGTDETRAHIQEMNILRKIQDTDYNYPGYDRNG